MSFPDLDFSLGSDVLPASPSSSEEDLPAGAVEADSSSSEDNANPDTSLNWGSTQSELLLAAETNLPMSSPPLKPLKPLKPLIPSFAPVGFKTAAGEKVQVSEKSLQEAKKAIHSQGDTDLFGEEPEELEEVKEETKMEEKVEQYGEKNKENQPEEEAPFIAPQPTPSGSLAGFQTASGHSVKVSSEALSKAKTLWSDTESEEVPIPIKEKTQFKPVFALSQQAVTKAVGLWKDAAGNSPIKRMGATQQGFTFSSQAMSKAMDMWKDAGKAGPVAALATQQRSPLPKKGASVASTLVAKEVASPAFRALGGRAGSAAFKSPLVRGVAPKETMSEGRGVLKRSGGDSASLGGSPVLPVRAAKRPRLTFKAPRVSMGEVENDSQDFEAQVMAFLDQEKL